MKTIATFSLPDQILELVPVNRSATISRAVEAMFHRGVPMTVAMALSRRLEADKKQGPNTKVGLSLDVELRMKLRRASEATGLSEASLMAYATEVFISTAIPSEA